MAGIFRAATPALASKDGHSGSNDNRRSKSRNRRSRSRSGSHGGDG